MKERHLMLKLGVTTQEAVENIRKVHLLLKDYAAGYPFTLWQGDFEWEGEWPR